MNDTITAAMLALVEAPNTPAHNAAWISNEYVNRLGFTPGGDTPCAGPLSLSEAELARVYEGADAAVIAAADARYWIAPITDAGCREWRSSFESGEAALGWGFVAGGDTGCA
jgi:hypothetical protein